MILAKIQMKKRRKAEMSHYNKEKTHCHRGHELFGQNLYINTNGHRQCRLCRKINTENLVLKSKQLKIISLDLPCGI